ncbi:MAG: hypothetical protein QOK02_6363 [Mycobacterium sp.]|jgi:hypothetical protein|nr:hypothetical protein [Mycobacterium sp.]
MTTPTTPAGWYPDPDGSGGLRYWDGSIWTEHRSPAAAAPDPDGESSTSEQATSVVSLPEQPTSVVPTGAHRAADQEPEPEVPTTAHETPSHETPSFGPPSYEPPTFETPSFEATAAQATGAATPSSEAPSAVAPQPEAPSSAPASYETPPSAAPSYEPPTYQAPSFETPSYETPSYGAPFAGSDATGGPPNNRKLITAYLGGVGVLLLALILAAVYGFVIRDNTPPQVTSSGSSASSTTSSASSTTKTSAQSPTTTPGTGDEATDGDFVFSVASTDSGDTITSPIDESVVKTANGQYFVVYVNVGNNGAAPVTWLSVLQLLSDGNQTFSPDVEASAALTGNEITVNPGEQLEVALAFDVPVGTVPTSIQLHGVPGSAGVELPV